MITYHYLSTYLTPVCQSKEVLNNDAIGIGDRSRNSVLRSEAASESIDSTRASVSVSFAEFSNHQISQIPNHHHQAYHAKCVITFKGRWLWLILTL